MVSIFLYLLIIIFLSIAAVYIFVWWRRTKWSNAEIMHGSKIYKLDIHNRKVKPYMINDVQTNAKKWYDLGSEMSALSQEGHELLAKAIHNIEKGSTRETFQFTNNIKFAKTKTFIYSFEINAIEDDSDFVLRFAWKNVNKKKVAANKARHLSKQEIIEYTSPSKGFIAFNTTNDGESDAKLVDIIKNLLITEKINYTITTNFLIILFHEKNSVTTDKKMSKFIKRMKANGFAKGANHLFNGSAYASSNSIDSMKRLNMLLQTLDFLINVSIETGNNFVSHKSDLNRNEFKMFTDASRSFRVATRNLTIDSILTPVKSYKTNRKKFDLAEPTIHSINEQLLSKIIRNKNNKLALVDAHATEVAVQGIHDEAVLVEINSDWLIKNASKMTYKKAIYVISPSKESYTALREVVEQLSAKNFFFALKISSYNEQISSFINNINIDFIVINKSIWGGKPVASSESIMNLMTINELAVSRNIKIIFQSPPEFISADNAKKIGLTFYY